MSRDITGRTVCDLCGKPADGPMLGIHKEVVHVPCVILALRQLLDPNWERGKKPALLPRSFISDIEGAE